MDGVQHQFGDGNQAADRGATFREGRQLRGRKCRPLAGARGLVQDRLHGLVRTQPQLGHFNIALRQCQEIIEIMRDAARQHAERCSSAVRSRTRTSSCPQILHQILIFELQARRADRQMDS
jgi:hypothetical protein